MHMAVFRAQLLKLVFASRIKSTKPTRHGLLKVECLFQNIVFVKLYCNCRCWKSYINFDKLSSCDQASFTYEYIDPFARGLHCIMPPKGKRTASAKVMHEVEKEVTE
jgi:hypothetical protein